MAVNTIRFSGLASGLDTDTLVQALVAGQKGKVDSEKQTKQLLELKKDKWKEINSKLLNFNSTLTKLRFASGYKQNTVTISNPNAIMIDKNMSIPEGTHTIKVNSMATGATVTTRSIKTTGGDAVKPETTLRELGITGSSENIKIGTETIDLDPNMTVKELTDQLSDKLGKEHSVKFDEKAGAFMISSKTTGVDQKIEIQASAGAQDALGITSGTYKGEDASITYNGGVTLTSSSNNNFEINGIKFNITSASTEPIIITSAQDTEKTVEIIKGFIDEYNKLLGELNTLVDAPKNKSYKPLTDEQKKDMSEADIKLWNERIDKSLMSGDKTLEGIIDSLRKPFEGKLSEFGISTTNWKDKGVLTIDEKKLRGALLENSDKVIDKLADVGKNLYDDFAQRLKGSNVKSTNSFYNDKAHEKKITESGKEIEDLEEKLARMEAMHYKKFTAMEKMMSQLNNQSSWLSSQLGGM